MNSPLKLRIIFAGTPDFAKYILDYIVGNGLDIVAIFCQPDRPKGRGRILTPCPVKVSATTHKLDIYQPESLNDSETQSLISSLNADIMIVVAYGQILPKAVLKSTKYGCLNIHASLLPRWRGAAPIQRSILAGDTQTGIGVMQMDEGLDTGDILLEKKCQINATDSMLSLHDKLAQLGAKAILEVLSSIGTLNPRTQSESGIMYAKKLTKDEAWIDWNRSADEINNQIRAFNPYPMAQTYATSNKFDRKVLRIISSSIVDISHSNNPGEIIKCEKSTCQIATGSGVININTVQLAGKNAVSIKDFNNAYKLTLLS